MLDNSNTAQQERSTEYKLISFLYKKSINLLETQIDQTKNTKDLLIILYKIHQCITDILSQPDHSKSLYISYEEFVSIINYEYNQSKQDDSLYHHAYDESEESLKKEIEDCADKDDIVSKLKRKLKHTEERNHLKEYNYLAAINKLMNSNKELEEGMHTFYPLNLKSSFSSSSFNKGQTQRNSFHPHCSSTKNSIPDISLNKKVNKPNQRRDNSSGHASSNSSNSLVLSYRGRKTQLKTPSTLRCSVNDSADLRKFGLYQKNRSLYIRKNFKIQSNILQIKHIIDAHDKSFTPRNPFKLPIKNYYSTFSNKLC